MLQTSIDNEIYCDGNAEQTKCFIQCSGYRECKWIKIIPQSNNIKELLIICKGRESCRFMEINLTNTQIMKMSMLCNSGLSCDTAQIHIVSDKDMEINIDCDDNDGQELNTACNDMIVMVLSPNILDLSVTCYKSSSCNRLLINGENADNMNLKMIMYAHSDDVEIIYSNYTNIEFICYPPNQTHFIQINEAKSETEIQALAIKQYDNNRFPCSGIHIKCTINKDITCNMEYKAIQTNIDTLKILSFDICYYVDIALLFDPNIECPDSCFVPIVEAIKNGDSNNNILYIVLSIVAFVVICIMVLLIFIICTRRHRVLWSL